MPDPETRELQAVQSERERVERERADTAATDADERAHDRRAERAAYLRGKLDERAISEDG